jgi:hypothetical protein
MPDTEDRTPEPEEPEVVAHSADGEDLPEDCGTFTCGSYGAE